MESRIFKSSRGHGSKALLSTLLVLSPGLNTLVASYPSLGPKDTLDIVNKAIAPDGFERSAVLVKGLHPAPLIKAMKGDSFCMNVVNYLTDDTMQRGTSIHWHGIFQRGTAWADGAAGVTQCPIAQNRSFLYQFDVLDQAGTFWYHSHYGTQYCDGLRGPLVIYDPKDPYLGMYDVDDESTVITLGDWCELLALTLPFGDANTIFSRYHFPSPSLGRIPVSDATLINGKGRYVHGPLADLSVIQVEYGRRYRFRLISVSCDPNFVFSIDGHMMTIIEADGEYTRPVTVESIQIFAGQRYSFVLQADQKVDNYWIRALPNSGQNGLSTGFVNGTNSAILRYFRAPVGDPVSLPGHPYPGGADIHINLNLTANNDGFLVNGRNFSAPPVPVLLQLLSGAHAAQDLLPKGDVYTLPPNKVVEVTIPGGVVGGPHPFHLHGHSFSVIKSAEDQLPNYVNPVRRDVVSIGDEGSNVTIRFETDNPGPWIFHCHIDFHLNAGLAVVFAEETAEAQRGIGHPLAWDQLCPYTKPCRFNDNRPLGPKPLVIHVVVFTHLSSQLLHSHTSSDGEKHTLSHYEPVHTSMPASDQRPMDDYSS
ncbi:Cupredoxin [Gymnopilus junonius]|uniref:Cupredoxin n=1 Tax=Gymnopilus junonius TaxID=109634 RepID=A0A9P5TP12_GYMJU|nr:Cupredoxin [Gymnopilus junonius]